MSILLAIVGATVGAVIGSLFMHWRNDVAKERQQLGSKTPYDYALTNAIAERDRLRDELVTLRALSNVQADTERIRNEIDTLLSDGGEEPTEDVYERNIGMPIRDNGDGTFSPITWDNRISSGEMADSADKAFAKAYGTNVREDDTKDEQLSGNDEERSYNHSVRQAFYDRTFVRVLCTGGMVEGEITAFNTEQGELTELQLNGIDVSIPAIIEITKGDDIFGETLYRKGDDVEDGRVSEDDVERSLINDIKDKASENLELAVEFAKMAVQDDEEIRKQLEETSKELAEEIRDVRRRMREFREEGKYYGETLYRKGSR